MRADSGTSEISADDAAVPAADAPDDATEDVPEEEKVWVLGYRIDPLYRFS